MGFAVEGERCLLYLSVYLFVCMYVVCFSVCLFVSPFPGVAQLRLGVVKDVFPGPGWGLVSTQDGLELSRAEAMQLLHGEHLVEAIWRW